MDEFRLKFRTTYLNLKKHTIPIQYGISAALITLLTVNYLLSINFILIGVYRLVEFTLLISIVFIIYSWLTILYGKSVDELTIFIILTTCLLIEFLTQFFDYNLTNSNNINDNNNNNNNNNKEIIEEERANNFLSNNLNYILIVLLNVLHSIYSNVNFVKTFIITFLLILTRFYAQFFYSNYLPQILNVYFVYICAFSGILFTKHLESQLINTNSNTNNNTNTNNCWFDTTLSFLFGHNNNKINNYSCCNGNAIVLPPSTSTASSTTVTAATTTTTTKTVNNKKMEKEEENHSLKSNSKFIASSYSINNTQVNTINNNKCLINNIPSNYKINTNLKQRRKLSVSSLPSMIPKRRISLPIITVKTDKVNKSY